MYKNYGDVNFFEYGRMVELQKDGTVNMLVCNPNDDGEIFIVRRVA